MDVWRIGLSEHTKEDGIVYKCASAQEPVELHSIMCCEGKYFLSMRNLLSSLSIRPSLWFKEIGALATKQVAIVRVLAYIQSCSAR